MKLSKNFSLAELITSETAVRHDLDNSPSLTVIDNLQKLVDNVLQPLRDKVGPVKVNSGYRSPAVNTAVGGSPTSDHCKGFAADIEVAGMSTQELARFINGLFPFTQLIMEFYQEGKPTSGWVHISYDPSDLKSECLRAVKQAGKTVYLKGL